MDPSNRLLDLVAVRVALLLLRRGKVRRGMVAHEGVDGVDRGVVLAEGGEEERRGEGDEMRRGREGEREMR